MDITGKDLIAWGYQPGPWFKAAIDAARATIAAGGTESDVKTAIERHRPPPVLPLRPAGPAPHLNIRPETPEEAENVAQVEAHMRELLRVPMVEAAAVMPDACSAGDALGTIPVGGVVASRAIHPGMHSADICCSMAVTIFRDDVDPVRVLNAGAALTHFGPGGRTGNALEWPDPGLLSRMVRNRFLADTTGAAVEHFCTQGDGNHFLYVGRVRSSGHVALVTHHGSRKPGAMLYKAGLAAAERHTRKVSPETPRHNAWLDPESEDGAEYWEALQLIRSWTHANHFAIHDLVQDHLRLKRADRFWNEHNFVFRRGNGLFYHGKGATPAWDSYALDANGLTLIPLNMAEPILIVRGRDAPHGLGFAPHGAGRNFSRTAYRRTLGERPVADVVAEQTRGLDVRFWCGRPDVSELPAAYKSAATVRRQIAEFGLADIVDEIDPIGCIMAGDWEHNAPWRRDRRPSA